MSYLRVIPRDLFNESDLLKCYGRMTILLDGNRTAGFETIHEYQGEPFDIVQDDDGRLTVWNLPLIVGRIGYRVWRPLNSREPWPVYLECPNDDDFEPISIFDDAGNFSDEMKALIK